jgi:hypothetical protein
MLGEKDRTKKVHLLKEKNQEIERRNGKRGRERARKRKVGMKERGEGERVHRRYTLNW